MTDFTHHPKTATTVSSSEVANHFDRFHSAKDRVIEGYNALTSPSTLSVTIEPGFAEVAGYLVGASGDSNVAKPLAAATTNHVFLSKFGVLEVNTSGTPADPESIKLWEITTNGSGTTSKVDIRDDTVEFDDPFRAESVEAVGNLIGSNAELRAVKPFLEFLDQTAGGSTLRIWGRNNKLQVTNASGSIVYVDDLAKLAENIRKHVISVGTNAPPGSPATNDRYIIGTSPTGAWAGQANKLAEWNGSAWVFTTPIQGWLVYATATNVYYLWNGTLWDLLVKGDTAATPNTLAQRDASGRLSVADATSALHAVNRQYGDGRYVNQGGDTMTGNLVFENGQGVKGKTTGGTERVLAFVDGSNKARIGDTSIPLQVEGSTNTPTYNGNTIWHAGNDGVGSGLDADLLDGQQPSQTPLNSRIAQYDSGGRLESNKPDTAISVVNRAYDRRISYMLMGV